jgi:hypothetical protein
MSLLWCSVVANCEGRVLVVVVNWYTIVMTVLRHSMLYPNYVLQKKTAYIPWRRSKENESVFVATGDLINGMIRMAMAESGKLLRQWQVLRERVCDVSITVKGGKVQGAYADGGD